MRVANSCAHPTDLLRGLVHVTAYKARVKFRTLACLVDLPLVDSCIVRHSPVDDSLVGTVRG